MSPQEFIQNVFITELEPITKTNAYISFSIIATGIEFLGKCLDVDTNDWNAERSKRNFNDAILKLDSLRFYRDFISEDNYFLFRTYRCGFAHSFKPRTNEVNGNKYTVRLCHANGCNKSQILRISENDFHLLLKVEDLYEDFKNACLEIINMEFPVGNKMNESFLTVTEFSIPNT